MDDTVIKSGIYKKETDKSAIIDFLVSLFQCQLYFGLSPHRFGCDPESLRNHTKSLINPTKDTNASKYQSPLLPTSCNLLTANAR